MLRPRERIASTRPASSRSAARPSTCRGRGLEVDVTPRSVRLLDDVHTRVEARCGEEVLSSPAAVVLARTRAAARAARRRPPRAAGRRGDRRAARGRDRRAGRRARRPSAGLLTLERHALEGADHDHVGRSSSTSTTRRRHHLSRRRARRAGRREGAAATSCASRSRRSDDEEASATRGGDDELDDAERVEAADGRRDGQRAHRSRYALGGRRQGDVRAVEPHARADREPGRCTTGRTRSAGDRVVVYLDEESERRRRRARSA